MDERLRGLPDFAAKSMPDGAFGQRLELTGPDLDLPALQVVAEVRLPPAGQPWQQLIDGQVPILQKMTTTD
jgi:hypothetical protein